MTSEHSRILLQTRYLNRTHSQTMLAMWHNLDTSAMSILAQANQIISGRRGNECLDLNLPSAGTAAWLVPYHQLKECFESLKSRSTRRYPAQHPAVGWPTPVFNRHSPQSKVIGNGPDTQLVAIIVEYGLEKGESDSGSGKDPKPKPKPQPIDIGYGGRTE